MHDYPLQVVEAMIASGHSFESIEVFIDDLIHVSEETRSALWLLAWTESSKENRLQCVAELINGERDLAAPGDRFGCRRVPGRDQGTLVGIARPKGAAANAGQGE